MSRFLLLQRIRHSGAGPTGRGQRGVTLLQLALMLAAVMALVVGLGYKTSDFFSKNQVLDSDALLRLADNQLRQYVVANGRLPCPDLNADGAEDYDAASNACKTSGGAAQQKGYLPYITLGMADKNYVYGEVPILYGVYNDGNDVDGSGASTGKVNLVSKTQVFFPTFANKTNTASKITNPRNIFDFCASLTTLEARGATVASSGLTVGALAPGRYTAVFALALPGQANRDGLAAGWSGGPSINAQYDGLNATSATEFELPQKQVSPTYDDRTAFRAAVDLRDYLRCEAMNNSISLLTEAVTIQQEVEDFADANDESATMGIVVNALGIALATWEVIQDIAAIVSASEQITIASVALALNTALCPLPPWVACALIPVYATALTSASIGMGLAIGAAVSAGVGLGLEIAATIYYADVKKRTTRPNPVYSQSATPTDSVTHDRLTKLKDIYVASRNAAATAYAAIPGAPGTSVTVLNAAQQAAAGVVSADIAAVTNAQLGSLLSNVLNGSSVVCTGDLSGCTKTQVPVLNSGSPAAYKKVNPDGTLSTCVPADHSPSTWCTENGYSQTQMNIAWSKVDQATGAILTCTASASTCKADGYSAAGQPVFTTVYVRNGLSGPYTPGVISSVDSYYNALGPTQTQNADGTVTVTPAPSGDVSGTLSASNAVVGSFNTLLADIADFDLKNIAYKTALNWEAAKLAEYNYAVGLRNRAHYCFDNFATDASCRTYDPYWNSSWRRADGLDPATHNGYTQADWGSTWSYQDAPAAPGKTDAIAGALAVYNDAVSATSVANGVRTTALEPVQTAMGNAGLSSSWNPTPSTSSLCGSSGCGWMTGTGSGAVNGQARTASSDVNSYLNAYETYRNTDAYAFKKKAADSAASNAWSDRNSLKSAACSVIKKSWVGGAFTDSTHHNPTLWDAYWSSPTLPGSDGRDGNNLYGVSWSPTSPATVVVTSVSAGGALKCDGGPTTAELKAKYCTLSSPDYNVDACKQYSDPATSTKTTPIIQDPAGIVNILIQKGIAL
ncbi:MAG: hypothetical protein ACOYNZ_06270 [Rhodoferax sp.]